MHDVPMQRPIMLKNEYKPTRSSQFMQRLLLCQVVSVKAIAIEYTYSNGWASLQPFLSILGLLILDTCKDVIIVNNEPLRNWKITSLFTSLLFFTLRARALYSMVDGFRQGILWLVGKKKIKNKTCWQGHVGGKKKNQN